MKQPHLFFLIIFAICLDACLLFAQKQDVDRNSIKTGEHLSLDKGWRFYLGDIPFPEIKGHSKTYNNAKAGSAGGAASPDFDDSEWRVLNLPHDWAVERPFDENANISQGYRPRGIGWYRRNIRIDPSDRGKNIELQFDGVATHCTVWFNGTVVHRNWCGYTSFYIDVTSMLKYGNDLNTLSIRVDAVNQEGWWYEGAGIYRHTWLVKRSPTHVITDGVFANPIKTSGTSWTIPGVVTLENTGKEDANVDVEMALLDDAGKIISQAKTTSAVRALNQSVATVSLPVANPKLWSIENPVLYKVKTSIVQQGVLIDEVVTTCGFRTILFTADSGFFLNDKPVKIKGVCNHQDAAGVGVAVPNSTWDFRLRKLKEMGANAYRCAHNPPAKEFLDACDRLGILVMDENRNFNASPEYIRQLQWLIRRDRNHPSVILWSVFNEEPMQGTEVGYEMVRKMNAEVKKLDTTRPVTSAMSGGLFAPINVSKAVDVMGLNYNNFDYDRFHAENPTLPMTSSEDVSGLIARGEFKTDKKKHLVDSYDTQKPRWGTTHRASWKLIDERPYLAGCFVWTGFDYRGEPTPYEWPTAGSNFGIMDQCGFPKSVFYFYQSRWTTKPVLQITPHWNWPADSVGKPIKVMVFSNAESVKLLVNGRLISEKPVDKYEMVSWDVPYQPGKVEAIGFNGGKEIARSKVETTGSPATIQLIPDRTSLTGDGWDAMPVTVQVVDAKGRPIATANLPIEFEVSGPANIIGLANGDPNSHEPEKGNKRSLYNGLAQVILQTTEGGAAPIVLTAKSPGLKQAALTVVVNSGAVIPSVAVVNKKLNLDRWRISPFSQSRPDPNQEISDNDMNSWAPIKPGQLQNFTGGLFVIYRTTLKPYAVHQKNGATIEFKSITGKAEVYIDSKLVATKTTTESGDLSVVLNPGQGNHIVNVLVEADGNAKAGLGGMITVEPKK